MDTESPTRILHLPSGHNFRDIGGYPAANGRTVKWRQIFRSGYMSRITGDDVSALHALGIDTICDFRANAERSEHPTVWHDTTPTELWARDYDFSAGALAQHVARPDVVGAEVRESMLEIYRMLPFEQADSYHELFDRIANGRIPLVFNCSAGKDRTRVASALLLSVLGVSRDDIEDDYMLTNETIDGLISYMESSKKYRNIVTIRREHALPLLRAEREYLETSFHMVEEGHGTVENYMTDVLGISHAQQDAIRANLLE